MNSSKYKFVSKVQATSSFLALQIILFFSWSIHWNLLLIIRTYFEEWTIQIISRITLVWILSPSLTFIGFFVSWSLPLINPTQPQPNTRDSSEIFRMGLVSIMNIVEIEIFRIVCSFFFGGGRVPKEDRKGTYQWFSWYKVARHCAIF